MVQIFGVKSSIKKNLIKGKNLHNAYMDLDKAYDKVDRRAMNKSNEGAQTFLVYQVSLDNYFNVFLKHLHPIPTHIHIHIPV